ncbi:YicS family protein [Pantoea cypripedii]|uniref:Uncharacterized protein YicS n=1 Tax=Pantoea cypripedii TaxID=55209 RepID=A0A6B9GF39_PANCY|nr:YicS family protein [Pantoea cypripedii]QGY31646.1 hypothetical protein CUN67_21935 [Pantoea cypripedii]
MRRSLLMIIFAVIPIQHLAASPYDSLATALREQTILQDLRAHCHVSQNISDEVMKKHFMDNPASHEAITSAAYELKNGKKQLYQQKISAVICPTDLTSK